MRNIKFTIFINRSPREVFDYLTDPSKMVEWQRGAGVQSANWLTDNPTEVGSIYHVYVRILGFNIVSKNEITDWNPPHRYSFRSLGGRMVRGDATRTFEAHNEGTQYTYTGQINSSGIFKLFEGIMSRMYEKRLTVEHDALKTILESGNV
jgi:carbon monoxide dehydrogenase subunit G